MTCMTDSYKQKIQKLDLPVENSDQGIEQGGQLMRGWSTRQRLTEAKSKLGSC